MVFFLTLAKCAVLSNSQNISGYKGKQVRDNYHSYDLFQMFSISLMIHVLLKSIMLAVQGIETVLLLKQYQHVKISLVKK